MLRILIVDDQKTIRETLTAVLETESDFEIIATANDGQTAMELAKELLPDLMLVDLEMPKLDGLNLTRLLQQDFPSIKVVVVSIHDQDEYIQQCLQAGAMGYLLKNTSPKDLKEAIRFVARGYIQFSPGLLHKVIPSVETKPVFPISTIKDQDYHSNLATSKSVDELARPISTTSVDREKKTHANSSTGVDWVYLWKILKRRWQPASAGFFGVLVGGLLYLLFAEKIYTSTALIMLEDRRESISELGQNLSRIPEGISEYSPLGSQAELIESRQVLQSAIDKVAITRQELPDSIDVDEIREDLAISIIPSTNLLEIEYRNSDPLLGTELLNAIVTTALEKNTESIRSEASSVRQFLENEVADRRAKVRQAEAAENQYRENQGIVATDNQTRNLVDRLSSLENQEQELASQIKEKKAKVQKLQQITGENSPESAYISGRASQDKELIQLRSQLSQVEAELSLARTQFTDQSPNVIDLIEKRDAIIALYNRKLAQISNSDIPSSSKIKTDEIGQNVIYQLVNSQVELSSLEDKLKAVNTERKKLDERISLLPARVQSLNELVLQREEAKESLAFLQRKLEEARIAEAQLLGNVQIVDAAELPDEPSAPNKILLAPIVVILGLALAFSIVLLLEKIDNTMQDGDEIKQKLNLPFLSSLPYLNFVNLDLEKAQLFLEQPNLYEPYRSLLKKLEVRCQNRLQLIVVSSTIAEEGKSVIASHLGAVAAMLSKRTLIIDAHLRQPQQNNLLNVKIEPGLRDIVTDNISLKEAIQPTKIENLSVLTTGRLTANSCTILESTSIKSILQEAINLYDLVIIDAPPTRGDSDAYTLSQYSNGLLIVTRPFHTQKNILEWAVSDLQTNNAPLLGFAINHTMPAKENNGSNNNELISLPFLLSSTNSNGYTKQKSVLKKIASKLMNWSRNFFKPKTS